jgi:hypothetical protein
MIFCMASMQSEEEREIKEKQFRTKAHRIIQRKRGCRD